MTIESTFPLLGFCAHCGTAKTRLLERLIPLLKGRRLKLALLKHARRSLFPAR